MGEYSLVHNGGFSSGDHWNFTNLGANDGVAGGSLKITGEAGKAKRAYQDFPIYAAKKAFAFSAQAKADSVPLRDEREFAVALTATYSDGTTQTETARFDVGDVGWQYASGVFVPEKNLVINTVVWS